MPDSRRNESFPPWLKAMQNGVIGEARARAFLLDRFWVLERSVDIEGADFIIQRRLTGRNLLDRQAPRLGVVQVKYFGNSTTHHFVHQEYVVGEDDELREEFFLLCYMGNEEAPRAFFLTGRDLLEQFPQITKNNNDGFSISYKQITSDSRFEITCPKRVLDRIEKQLEFAEFTKNRKFISWALPSAQCNLGAIRPEYAEPIDNWWGDIPSGFEGIKRAAQQTMHEVAKLYELLLKLSQEADPLKAEEILDEIGYNFIDDMGHWSISLPDDLRGGEFFTVCRRHKEIYDKLKTDGLLDSFFKMKEELRDLLLKDIQPLIPISKDLVHLFSFTYDSCALKILSLDSKVISKQDYLCTLGGPNAQYREGIVNYSSGQIEYAWAPGANVYLEGDGEQTIDWYRMQDFYLYYSCIDQVFSIRYDQEVDI